jgi:uncharacterized protein (DUF433 family)
LNTRVCAEFNNNIYFKTYNILKALGLKTSHNGTKLIIKTVLKLVKEDDECITFEDIYLIISKELGNISKEQIRYCIKYAIDKRNKNLSENNFEKIFGYEYDEYLFTNKELIEEIVRIINSSINE